MRRNRLAYLWPAAWTALLARGGDPVSLACLSHWAQRNLPLVVTVQRPAEPGDAALVSLGLAAPLLWERRRLPVQVPPDAISSFGDFPLASDLAETLPLAARPAWAEVAAEVAATGATMRVYGSHGWQRLSGLPYVRDTSDIDLCIAVDSPLQADRVVALLGAFAGAGPRLDGELMFANGDAVHWREWAVWRRGAVQQLLVKRLRGAALVHCYPVPSLECVE